MDSSVSPKDEIWFLRVCHHISTGLYHLNSRVPEPRIRSKADFQINILKPTVYFMYHHVLYYKILRADYIPFTCFISLSEQTVTLALYITNTLVLISEVESHINY